MVRLSEPRLDYGLEVSKEVSFVLDVLEALVVIAAEGVN